MDDVGGRISIGPEIAVEYMPCDDRRCELCRLKVQRKGDSRQEKKRGDDLKMPSRRERGRNFNFVRHTIKTTGADGVGSIDLTVELKNASNGPAKSDETTCAEFQRLAVHVTAAKHPNRRNCEIR
jgi:hypothetical protein